MADMIDRAGPSSRANGALDLVALAKDRDLGRLISAAERGEIESIPDGVLKAKNPLATQVIGVTGPPGAGKSTLVDQMVACARSDGLTVGVIAVDPSSPFSGGAVLGDRLRMSRHSNDPGVFIRSMGSRFGLGGLARATRTALRLLAQSGRNIVIIETVGVGQAELDIMNIADTVAVVTVPGLGDGVQMNKAGIMEIGDVFVVNMADRPGADQTKRDLEQAIHLGDGKRTYTPQVLKTVGADGTGVEALWRVLRSHFEFLNGDDGLAIKRAQMLRNEIVDRVVAELAVDVRNWVTEAPDKFDAAISGAGQNFEAISRSAYLAARAFLADGANELPDAIRRTFE